MTNGQYFVFREISFQCTNSITLGNNSTNNAPAKDMENFNIDNFIIVTASGVATSLLGIFVVHILAKKRDKKNSKAARTLKFIDFSNKIIADLNNFDIKSSLTINASIEHGEPLIIDITGIVRGRKAKAINDLWERYKYETYYNITKSGKPGEFVAVGRTDGERRKKAISILNEINAMIK